MGWGTFGCTLGANWDNLGHFGYFGTLLDRRVGTLRGHFGTQQGLFGTPWFPRGPLCVAVGAVPAGGGRPYTAPHRPIDPTDPTVRPRCAAPGLGEGWGGLGLGSGQGGDPSPPPPRTLGALWGYGAGSALGPQICFRGERWGWGGVVQLCGIGGEGEKGKSEEERENGGQKVGGDRGKKGKKGEKGVGDCRGCGAGTCGAPPSLTHGAKVAAALRKWPRSHSRPRSPQIRLHAGRGRAPLRSPIGTGLWGPHNSIGTGIGVSPKRWRFRDPASPREPDLRSSGAP